MRYAATPTPSKGERLIRTDADRAAIFRTLSSAYLRLESAVQAMQQNVHLMIDAGSGASVFLCMCRPSKAGADWGGESPVRPPAG